MKKNFHLCVVVAVLAVAFAAFAAAGHHGAPPLAVRLDRGRLTLATTGDDGTSGMEHVSIYAPSAKRSEFAC